MSNLAIIPARAGSKRIKNKNRRKIDGKTLVEISVNHARESESIDGVVFTSDDMKLVDWAYLIDRLKVISRDPELATDEAEMIDVVNDVRDKFPDYDTYCLLQPTTPNRCPSTIDKAYRFLDETCDGVVTVNSDWEPNGNVFLWKSEYFEKPESERKLRPLLAMKPDVDYIWELQIARWLKEGTSG